MLDSKNATRKVGFSTGALEKGNFRRAVEWLLREDVQSVELSALRFEELEPLVNALSGLPVDRFSYVSFHAPSSFPAELEDRVVELLEVVRDRGWNVVVHPDVIRTPALWRRFGTQLLIENMDRRKAVGRSARELESIFEQLPDARLCLDLAHARQLDTTLTVLRGILRQFSSRVAEIHISELDSRCSHQPLSCSAVKDYKSLAGELNAEWPIIIESMLDGNRAPLRRSELELTEQAVRPNGTTRAPGDSERLCE